MPNDPTTPMTDTDSLPTRASLLSRVRQPQNHPGWEEFYTRYRGLIYRLARRGGLSESEAQDAVQETMIVVARQMPTFRYDPSKGSFKGWLSTIVRCRVVDQFRRRAHEPAVDEITLEQIAATAPSEQEAEWDEEWRQHILKEAITRTREQVSPGQFQLFDLFVFQQVPIPDIKRLLGVNAPQVYVAKFRVGGVFRKALQAVREELEA